MATIHFGFSTSNSFAAGSVDHGYEDSRRQPSLTVPNPDKFEKSAVQPNRPMKPSRKRWRDVLPNSRAELSSRIPMEQLRGGYGPYQNGNSSRNANPNSSRDPSSNYYPNTNPNSNPNSNANSNQYQSQSSPANSNQYPCQSLGANSNQNCFRCGVATHWSRECPLAETDLRAPSADSRRPPPPQPQQNVRPTRYGSNGPNKVCIWIKYHQYHLSV